MALGRLSKKKLAVAALLLVLIAAFLFFYVAPIQVDRQSNRVVAGAPFFASARAVELHKSLFVADLHADSFLWGRDLAVRNARGHVDLPRMREGNAALQVFSAVTKVPRGLNIERNDSGSDVITYLAIASRWPRRTWSSLLERALFQASRADNLAAASGGQFLVVRTADDLENFLRQRDANRSVLGGILAIEGAQAIEGRVENVDRLADAGFRMMSPAHFFDTEVGGSAAGVTKGGLTQLGREVVARMEARGMIVDVAHSSGATIRDVLAIAKRPVVASHTGVRGTCDNQRNLSDAEIRGIARTGGLIGIGFWDTATCGNDARAIARAIRYTANLVGADHVALGSDFDGAVVTPFDASGMVLLTEALVAEGFTDTEIRMIMGGNLLRLFRETLPRGKPELS